MALLGIIGLCLAFTRLPIITLWFLAGTLRLSSFTPTVLSVLHKKYNGYDGTISIWIGIILGSILFGLSLLYNEPFLQTAAMLTALISSTTISVIALAKNQFS